ncbi:MAG: UvrD-helicase domain-containing protein [Pseudomonadota bacterium]|nr:UvrD-helicase domain-containing protein [Pseudomonadota bacterium]
MSDAAVRHEVLDTTKSFCVTAPAGSGKTSLLTQRVLALLVTVERPEQVLAITFTRKAAAEMRERVMEALDAAKQGIQAENEHEARTQSLADAVLAHSRALNWSFTAESLNIRTIDGLAAQLNRVMPVLSGLGGGITVTDDVLPLYQKASSELYELVGEESSRGEALRQLLLSMDNNWQRCSELLIELLGRRADWLPELGQHTDPEGASQRLTVTVQAVISERLSVLTETIDAHWLSELEQQANAAVGRLKAYVESGLVEPQKVDIPAAPIQLSSEPGELSSWQWVVRWILTGDEKPRKRLDKNNGFQAKVDQTVKDEVLGLISELEERKVWLDLLIEIAYLPSTTSDDQEWQGVLHLSRVLPTLAAQLLTVFRSRGVVDHTHIAMSAEAALGTDEEPTDLALRLDYQLAHILVDEFQDTSQGQYRLLEKLCRGWSEHNHMNPRHPRTLFIVGDAMQSIYGFRYADVGLFLKAREEGIAGVLLNDRSLSRNFRSQAGVIDWVNRQFSSIVPKYGDRRLGIVPMTIAEATRSAGLEQAVEIHNFPDDRARETNFVFSKICELLSQSSDSTIGVLARTRSSLEPISRMLRDNGIDIVGSDLTSFSRRAAVMDLVSLTRYLANPADTVALIAILRSPMVGLTLKDLGLLTPILTRYSLAAAVEKVADGSFELSTDGQKRSVFALKALLWAEGKRDRLNLVNWVEEAWKRLGGDLILPIEEEPDTRSFFHQLRDQETEGAGLDADRLVTWLETKHATIESTTARVELMTLHRSKGLEFDHVFIVGAGKSGRSSQKPLLRWNRDEQNGLLIAARPASDVEGTLYDYLGFVNKRKEAQELIRLYYVGITRARESCSVTATMSSESQWPPRNTGSFWSNFCSAAPQVQFHPPVESQSEVAVEQGHSQLLRVVEPPDRLLSETVEASPASALTSGNLQSRRYGTALHRGLELLALQDPLPTKCPDSILRAMRFQLTELSSPSADIAEELDSLIIDVNRVLGDEVGRWVLAGRHHDAHSELSLFVAETQKQLVVDRTFIDAQTGIRWIIDYKTSRPAQEDSLTDFLSEEAARYRDQLLGYRSAMQLYDQYHQPDVVDTRVALYFSALAELYELPIYEG